MFPVIKYRVPFLIGLILYVKKFIHNEVLTVEKNNTKSTKKLNPCENVVRKVVVWSFKWYNEKDPSSPSFF
jgi:hypothetical protein